MPSNARIDKWYHYYKAHKMDLKAYGGGEDDVMMMKSNS